MDAPPESEPVQPFLKVTFHLQKLGVRVPEIMFHDTGNGFILMEDLGTDTFTTLLYDGGDELTLYQSAIDVLTGLHSNSRATDIHTGEYDFEQLIGEARLFTDWYLPAAQPQIMQAGHGQRHASYVAAWQTIFNTLPQLDPTLVLRDYHVDNLIMVNNACAVIDYQDALIGSPAYDVVSLLEDARRNISDALSSKILARYFRHNPWTDRDTFMHHYAVWGAQRHCKVAGIFVRLWQRDHKPHYLNHLSRVMKRLENSLRHPALKPLANWCADHNICLTHPPIPVTRPGAHQYE